MWTLDHTGWFKSWILRLLAACPWASPVTSLTLNFSSWSTREVTVLVPEVTVGIRPKCRGCVGLIGSSLHCSSGCF